MYVVTQIIRCIARPDAGFPLARAS